MPPNPHTYTLVHTLSCTHTLCCTFPRLQHPPTHITADKKGAVGFWHLNGHDDDPIVEFRPHSQYICGLKWLGPSGRDGLLTTSYDGSVRRLDLGAGGQWLLAHSNLVRGWMAVMVCGWCCSTYPVCHNTTPDTTIAKYTTIIGSRIFML